MEAKHDTVHDHGRLCRICLAERLLGRRTQAVVAAGVLAVASVAPPAAFAQQAAEDPRCDSPRRLRPGRRVGELPQEATDAAGRRRLGRRRSGPGHPPRSAETAQRCRCPRRGPRELPTSRRPRPRTRRRSRLRAGGRAAGAGRDGGTGAPARGRVRPERRGRRRAASRQAQQDTAEPQGAHDAAGGPGGAARRPTGDAGRRSVGAAAGRRAAAVATAPAPAAAPARHAARATGGWHVIQRGESLWSIAAERLGSGASTASIAAEVERLWALNQDRIGTGNRDVVLAGTRIKL